MNPRLQKRKLAFIGMRGLPPDLPGAGGGERETDAKTRRLAARGWDVTVYCRWNYTRRPPERYEGVRLVSLPAINRAGLETLSHTFLATLHALTKQRADVISYHGMGNALFLPLVRLAGKRSVVYMDGIDWERPKWGRMARLMLKWGAAAAFRWGDFVYVDNEASQREFQRYFGRQPHVITLGADLWPDAGHELLAQFGLEPESYLLFVGMLRPDKGVHLLIEAYSELATDIPLVIVGENPDDPAYVRQLKERSDGRVRFLGYQYGETARQLFAHALIYVQPSVMEGNSPALMSAMACGRCVVVNGIEQNRETIGDAGVAFAAGDAADLRARLAELLADREQVHALGQKARQRIEEVYNWDTVVDQLDQVYGAELWAAPNAHQAARSNSLVGDTVPTGESSARMPRVTIGLPVYNGENFVGQAIESVLGQTYQDWELVISDNASTDGTEAICRCYAEKDDRIRYIRSPENRGAAWNYNQTFLQARGRYFRWLAHDDMLAPTLLEKSVFILDSYPDVVLCFTWTKDIDHAGAEIAIKSSTRNYAARRPSERFYSLGTVVPWHNCEEVFGLIRAEILSQTNLIGNYTDSDRTLLAQLALFGPFYQVAEPLFGHRIHESSSVVVNPVPQDRAAWFDPRLKGKLVMPVWRQSVEMLRVVLSAPVPWRERANALLLLARWVKRRRKALMRDLRWAARPVL